MNEQFLIIGEAVWIIAVILWMALIIRNLFRSISGHCQYSTEEKVSDLYSLCLVIGLMIVSMYSVTHFRHEQMMDRLPTQQTPVSDQK